MWDLLEQQVIRNLNDVTDRNIKRTNETTDRIIERRRRDDMLLAKLDKAIIALNVQKASTHSAAHVLREAMRTISALTGEPLEKIEARIMATRAQVFDQAIETMMNEGALQKDPRTPEYVGHFSWYKHTDNSPNPQP